ncbi:hypothetical protein SDC9_135131 [bioreactor metagenome]|uniref:Uncharacterized protein n=1 Tax=bioreactor metagenome TaxID=1076179 RepID=A0A645DEW9_9ZZZZ
MAVLHINCSGELAVDSIVFQHVSDVIHIEQIVDTYNLNVVSCLSCPEN